MFALGILLLAAAFGCAIGITFTRASLRRLRYPDQPMSRFHEPFDAFDEFQESTYLPGAAPLVRRLRLLFAGLMVTAPLGALLFFQNRG